MNPWEQQEQQQQQWNQYNSNPWNSSSYLPAGAPSTYGVSSILSPPRQPPAAALTVVTPTQPSSHPVAAAAAAAAARTSSSSSSSSHPTDWKLHASSPISTTTASTAVYPYPNSMPAVTSAAQSSSAAPAPASSSHFYFLVVLDRPSLQQRWGLHLTLIDGHVEVFSSAAENKKTSSCSSAWCTLSPHPPTWWWTCADNNNNNNTGNYGESSMTTSLQSSNNQTQRLDPNSKKIGILQFMYECNWIPLPVEALQLERGDVLVTINGQVIPGPCQDIKPVFDIFQKSDHLAMVIARRNNCSSSSSNSNNITPTMPTANSRPTVAIRLKSSPAPPPKGFKPKSTKKTVPRPKVPIVLYRNPFFKDPKAAADDETFLGLPFADDLEFEPDEGKRAALFLTPVHDVKDWIQTRKRKWRESYKVYSTKEPLTSSKKREEGKQKQQQQQQSEEQRRVPVDFWTPQGFGTFQDWLHHRTCKWRLTYSWQKVKRQRIQNDMDNTKAFCPTKDFYTWLRVRKTQWRLARRQRQRAVLKSPTCANEYSTAAAAAATVASNPASPASVLLSTEDLVMDGLLEEEEQKERQRQGRPPLDISWLFDVDHGCPDDVVAHCMGFLQPEEHYKLLALNRETRLKLSQRETVWRLLCPSRWVLPRRPRQPWHILYWTKLQTERQDARKRWDDLLTRALNIVAKGDHLASLERIVNKAERDDQFNVNYCSGVVCERNSLLNLAVIHQRHKIVRWLVEEKGADLESADRGDFTPLLNAAWAGDKVLVRFFLAHGANRRQVGTSHYTRPLAVDFKGLDAAGWAEYRGYSDLATLIKLGL